MITFAEWLNENLGNDIRPNQWYKIDIKLAKAKLLPQQVKILNSILSSTKDGTVMVHSINGNKCDVAASPMDAMLGTLEIPCSWLSESIELNEGGRLRGISKQMDDYCDMMDVIDLDPSLLKPFSKIVTNMIKDALAEKLSVSKYLKELGDLLFSDADYVISVLKYKKTKMIDYQGINDKLNQIKIDFPKIIVKNFIEDADDDYRSVLKYITMNEVKQELEQRSINRGRIKFANMLNMSQLKK